MLDGQRYFSEFPDEEPEQPKRLLLSDELLVTLAAIEREISEFIGDASDDKSNAIGAIASGSQAKD
ncbi:MAG TPA: hypothetical protein VFB68_21250 [Xanthobacteraceae bacterium]|nr:hypothetical protein [Xanthobacteraceae bacterium]